MTTPVYPAGQTPYCTIPELLAAPTGISLRLVDNPRWPGSLAR
jgi:hypothetical protein